MNRSRFDRLNRFYETADTERAPSRPSLSFAALGGREIDTEFGTTLLLDRTYAWEALPGGASLAAIRAEGWNPRHIDPRLPEHIGLERAACVDIETTGLSLGAGTVAFLVGVVTARSEGAHLQQYLIRDFSEEAAQQQAIAGALSDHELVVTYNGGRFDLPILRTRAVINRIDAPWLEHPHLDLLHAVRAVWRGVWPDCRLATAELRLLGVERTADCEGWEVPLRYRQFLTEQSETPLIDVLEHNAQDLLSLLGITAVVQHLFAPSREPFGLAQAELLGLGRALLHRQRPNEAVAVLGRAREMGRLDTEFDRGMRLLVRLLKRRQDWLQARTIWSDLQSAPAPVDRFWAHIEEAKYAEHQERDPGAALVACDRAGRALAELGDGDVAQRLHRHLVHRKRRLCRRLETG